MPGETARNTSIERVRRFSRFYTQKLGILHRRLLHSPFSLTEARVIYELAHREATSLGELAVELELDKGYLSRLVQGLERRGLVERQVSQKDGRRRSLSLSDAGKEAFALLNARSRAEVEALLQGLSPSQEAQLVGAMDNIEALLGAEAPRTVPYILRPHQPGDMGWVVHRQAVLYSSEFGWDESFEALLAQIVGQFLYSFDPKTERCWIAERDGEIVGSVFVVKQDDRTAKLRLLYVEPSARGLGIGARLVEECIRFSRRCGYETLTLWTNDVLVAARHLYEAAGLNLVAEEPHHSFGKNLVGQTWELTL